MIRKHIPKKNIVIALGDALLIIASFYICYAIRCKGFVDVFSLFTRATGLSLMIFLFVFYIADIYDFESGLKSLSFVIRFAVALIAATGIIAATFYIFSLWQFSRLAFLYNMFFIFSFLLAWRYVFDIYIKNKSKLVRTLIIGAGKSGRTLYRLLEENNYKIVGFLDDDVKKSGMEIGSSRVIGDTSLLPSLVKDKGIDKVIITIRRNAPPDLIKRVMNVKFNGVDIRDFPSLYEEITGKIPTSYVTDNWFGYANFYGLKKNIYNKKIKMVLDKIIAVLILILSLPVTVLSVLIIKLSDGPVFFRQERVGENAGIFNAVKFRTMECGKEHERGSAGLRNDPRITKIGRVLRFFRIDEIPQLWNVIKGEMSLIGPRALVKEEVEVFTEKIPYFIFRHSVKPGITGWAQVNHKHGKEINDAAEKLQYDLFYIRNLSPILDLHILLKTVKVVMLGRGAR